MFFFWQHSHIHCDICIFCSVDVCSQNCQSLRWILTTWKSTWWSTLSPGRSSGLHLSKITWIEVGLWQSSMKQIFQDSIPSIVVWEENNDFYSMWNTKDINLRSLLVLMWSDLLLFGAGLSHCVPDQLVEHLER